MAVALSGWEFLPSDDSVEMVGVLLNKVISVSSSERDILASGTLPK